MLMRGVNVFKPNAIIFAVMSLFPNIESHSWITCTDYLEENGEYWNAELCR